MASKKIEIGNRRYVVVKKDEIRIFEDGANKYATFTYPRWANFVKQFDKIDQSIAANDGGVKLQLHIGGGWFVSVTSYVDIRKFCRPPDAGARPTRTGIALRLHEWSRLKAAANKISRRYPRVASAQPCRWDATHYNQEGAMNCSECNPFNDW